MSGFHFAASRAKVFDLAGRVIVILAIWLTSTVIASAGYQVGASRQDDFLSFAVQFAAAMAASTVVVLAIGGRRRRAAEVGLSTAGSVAIGTGLAYLAFRLAPVSAWRRLGFGYQQYFHARRYFEGFAWVITYHPSVLGLILGLGIGGIAGSLMLLARRRPRLALSVGMGLLIAFGASSSFLSGEVANLVLVSRMEGGRWLAASISGAEVAGGIGAASGAVVGAMLACGTLRGGRGFAEGVRSDTIAEESIA